jgi:uncharacterized protein (TIGR02001 family)
MALKTTRHAGLLCTTVSTALLIAAPASARDGFGGSIAVATDYLYRGVSRTRREPAVQGGVEWQSVTGWNAGAWASKVEYLSDMGPRSEIDLHLAHAWTLGPDWSTQVGWTHYLYPNDDGFDYDYDELAVSVSYQQRLTASIAWSPNTTLFGNDELVHDKQAIAYELAVLQPVDSQLSLAAGVGYYDLSKLFGTGYWYWNAGLIFTFNAFQVDVMRIGADGTAADLFEYSASGGRWSAALSWRF